MSKVVFWAHSYCRSTLATYAEAKRLLDDDAEIIVGGPENPSLRKVAGFDSSEFADLDLLRIDPSLEWSMSFLRERRDSLHVFCDYQSSSIVSTMARIASGENYRYVVASEAPLNMEPTQTRRWAKEAYLRAVLPRRVRQIVRNASGFVNFSGAFSPALHRLGWDPDQTLDFGYFSPPLIPGGVPVKPYSSDGKLRVLLSGSHTWHRAPDVLLDALARFRKDHGFSGIQVDVCGSGPLTMRLMQRAHSAGLPIKFHGFVSFDILLRLYQEAHVFVGTGRAEPWGIRVNDALSCGCIPVVSDGMGIASHLSKWDIGVVFPAGDSRRLSQVIANLLYDREFYRSKAESCRKGAVSLAPQFAARRLLSWIRSRP